MSTKIAITGGEGFIGSHLARELDDRGYEFISLDQKSGHGDFTEPGVIRDLLTEYDPDIVVHLAAQVGRLFGEDDLIHTVQSNALMTTMVANACSEIGARMVYASTSEIYGDQGEKICFEHGPLRLSHNLYGVSKYWGEHVAALYAANGPGLQVLRLSMPYGPGMLPGRGRAAIVNMLWQANTGQVIPVHRGAERAWCWVGDTVRGIADVIDHGEVAMAAWEWEDGIGVYNVGRSDNPVSMSVVAEMACDIAGADNDLIDIVSPPAMQTVVKRLSNEKLRTLGWSPSVDLREGMEAVFESVKFFDANGDWQCDDKLSVVVNDSMRRVAS
jgi:nucleoside-diphosphate-sugar epimerase